MNLVMFTQTLDREASVQGFAHEWVRTLSERVERLFVIANEVGSHDLPDNVRVMGLGAEEGVGRLGKLGRFFGHLREIIPSNRIDGAFVHQVEHYGLVPWVYLKYHGIPIVQFKAHKGIPWTLRVASWLFDYFVTSSEDGLELDLENKRVIGQGIDTERFSPGPGSNENGPYTITTIGRISPVKGYETLLEAVRQYDQRDPGDSVRVRIVGGPGTEDQQTYLEALKRRTEEFSIDDRVEFVPPVPNRMIVEEYRQCDLFVNLSRTGSLDKAVLEAMACECCVVTSNWAYRDVFPGSLRKTCMIEPGDVEALVERIDQFRGMRGTAEEEELTARLRKIVVDEHNLERFMDRLVEVFENPGAR